jgi:RNA polymerase sigma factor (sigma-70 family)
MTAVHAHTVVRHLRTLTAAQEASRLPDRDLLERFAASRDEAAFEALLRRHAPMVWAVCRRVLGDWHDAEDAFQAAFLALARQAGSIRRCGSAGSWLYRVACHAALRLRSQAASRKRREGRITPQEEADPLAEVTARELLAVLDEELARLPEAERAPLVLCYLQGLTRDEAARQLSWSLGTLKRRLGQGLRRLRSRLGRRGLALPAGLLAAGIVRAEVPAGLAAGTIRQAVGAPATPTVAALADAVSHGRAAGKLRAFAALLIVSGLLPLGLGLLAHPAVQSPPEATATPMPARPVPEDEQEWNVTGRVVNEKNDPVKGAQVAAVVCLSGFPAHGEHRLRVLGSTHVDAMGRFRLVVRDRPDGRIAFPFVVAAAPGHGLGNAQLAGPGGRQDVSLRLPPEVILRARLIDLQGAPASGVELRLREAMSIGTDGPGSSVWGADGELPFWPRTLTTDRDGRVTVRGFGRGQRAGLEVCDERFAPRWIYLTQGEEPTQALEPVQLVTGRVVAADTGRPIAGARLEIVAYHYGQNYISTTSRQGERTDTEGHFRIAGPPSQNYTVQVLAPEGQPYLGVEQQIAWPKGAVRHKVEISLPRGVVIRGQVVEEGSGKPVAGARLIFHPRGSDTIALSQAEKFVPPNVLSYKHSLVRSGADGSFQVSVPEAPGHLLVVGPTPNYVTQVVGNRELYYGKPGGYPRRYHAALPLDLRGGGARREVTVKLRRGVTVRGEIVGPDGKPIDEGVVVGAGLVSPFLHLFPEEHETTSRTHRISAGHFELPGCDPEKTYRLYFLSGQAGAGGLSFRGDLDARAGLSWYGDKRDRLGATVEVSVRQTAEKPLVVRLEPCGWVTGKFRGPDGKPVRVRGDWLQLVVAPGPALEESLRSGILAAEKMDVSGPHDERGQSPDLTDTEGLLWLYGLIPGAAYRVDYGGFTKDFTARASAAVELGEVRLPKP